jgi:NAD(P)-dependent dehydrogenase (short-subunit alcohol dehydrogenase family)
MWRARCAAGRHLGGLRPVVLMMRRSVIVTGAFGVLGAAVARSFAGQGAQLGLIDVSSVPAWASAEFATPHVLCGGIDLADAAAASAAVRQCSERAGGLDVLVNVAGGFQWQLLAGGGLEVWDAMYTVNLKTAVAVSSAALPYLGARGAGRVVNIGAGAAARAAAGMGAYTASKAGVERLTEALAEELKDRNVTVNCVLPGTLDTPRNRADMPHADFSRWVAPEAVADVVTFLASDAARAVTGAAIRVFGRG